MNTAYEIEYCALKLLIEKIGFTVEKLMEKVSDSLKKESGINSEETGELLAGIEEMSHRLELETMRFLVEHKPKDSDLRSVLVLLRLSNGFSEMATLVSSIVEELKDPSVCNTIFYEVTKTIRDVMKELNNAIAEEDVNSKPLVSKSATIDSHLKKWYRECNCLIENSEVSPVFAVAGVKCATLLEQTGKLLESLISDLVYMITGSHELTASTYTVVALE